MTYTVATTDEFDDWLGELADEKAKGAITDRIVRVQSGLFGDSKSLGDKVSELRIHVGPGYRVYYTIQARVVVILLCGGDKSDQKQNMKLAKKLAAEL
ncbi:type II toxin-antitoxin system RelE/ParE family toxin [Sphingomonas sp. LaA6.9]|uniref:type II toxin-antitoxin system RelE/ParE family toxin n=1 Tax=Sphingomonas sp. LaA6.9 TaxID=2919914 RepID=UPI001F4F5879|nr:type II toxin-antitoxin system RelE/ParE family toxin [Sphingomonas sp. LaA6.9]MCJ8158359.1 type II toxin-antitoxin system RelE/ParE family toxin [Sphingomonas sp. LaA6.9]